MVMPLWGYVAAGSLLAGGIGGWVVRDWKADADAAAQTQAIGKAIDVRRMIGDAAALAFEGTRERLDQQNYATNTVIREYYDANPASPDCAVPAPVASSLRDAVEGANAAAAGKPAPALPSDPAAP